MNIIELNKKIASCHKCKGLNIPDKTMSAPGYGSKNAELFVIGQSLHSYNPETPDRQIPFVGPSTIEDSGNFIFDILNEAGYSFDDMNLFISNVVHCHPPDNRPSKTHEKENCREYLQAELEFVKPKKILLLGRDAREWFKFSRQGKTSKRFNGEIVIFIVAHHPSYVLRYAPSIKENYERELIQLLRRKL
jgi:DNA polymerase